MWQFIISGYIPGTDLQLTYETLATFFLTSSITLLVVLIARDEKKLRTEISEHLKTKAV